MALYTNMKSKLAHEAILLNPESSSTTTVTRHTVHAFITSIEPNREHYGQNRPMYVRTRSKVILYLKLDLFQNHEGLT